MKRSSEILVSIFFVVIGGFFFLYPGVWAIINHPDNVMSYFWICGCLPFFIMAREIYTSNYKLSRKELRERASRYPNLTCDNCGQTASLLPATRGNAHMKKVKYDDKCPYCRK